MKLKKIYSNIPKHRGCIFLKREGSKDHFVAKVYSSGHSPLAEEIADAIIKAAESITCRKMHNDTRS